MYVLVGLIVFQTTIKPNEVKNTPLPKNFKFQTRIQILFDFSVVVLKLANVGRDLSMYRPRKTQKRLEDFFEEKSFWVVNGVSRRAAGRDLKTLCIKINYNEPSKAESREVSSTLAESYRVFLGDIMLEFVRLTKF